MRPAEYETFGELLKYLRRRARLTQKELSIATGYSESHISRLEKNQRVPEPTAVAALFIPALELKADSEEASRLLELANAPSGRWGPPRIDSSMGIEQPVGNLHEELSSFIGRTRELRSLVNHIRTGRLVTLTGTGGVGKTRLALRVAARLQPDFPAGAWFVELASLEDSELIPGVIIATLGMHEVRERSVAESLLDVLRPRRLLLVLDNCEHLVAGVAGLVKTLLRHCPDIRILATSREPLNVTGEVVFLVPPLRLPGLGWASDATRAAQSEAVQLFVDRARTSQPGFEINAENAAAVSRICARLDGIPLAIELAAARIRILQPQQIAARLDDRFALLTEGPRDLPERHRTLQAVIDWSYALLAPAEQQMLNRLSVFSGSFTLDAVEAVCMETIGKNLELLTRLVDRSLVLAEPEGEQMRYRLLETVRQYAAAHLIESRREAHARRCHAEYVLKLTESVEPLFLGPQRHAAMQQLNRNYEDVRATLEWAQNKGEEVIALRLVATLFWFWHFRGSISEGRKLAETVLATTSSANPSPEKAMALGKSLWAAGVLAWVQGDMSQARQHLETSVTVLEHVAAPRARAHALSNLGLVLLEIGEADRSAALTRLAVNLIREAGSDWELALLLYNCGEAMVALGREDQASPLLEESLRLFRQLGDPWGIAVPLFLFGLMAGNQGDFARSREHFEEAYRLQLGEGDWWGAAEALLLRGQAHFELGDFDQAASCFAESLRINTSHVGDRWLIARALLNIALLCESRGNFSTAARLLGAQQAMRTAIGGDPNRRTILRRSEAEAIAALRNALGESTFAVDWQIGTTLTADSAVALARDALA